jgi:tricorn protease
LTPYNDKGVRAASVFHDTAAYVQDGRIHLFNLMPGGADQLVNFTISPDTSELAPRTASALRSLEQILPSPSGDKLVVGARGDILTYETSTGAYKNLTNTPGIAERYPVISPDGRSIAYFSDQSGEYAIHVRSLTDDSVKKITIEPKASFYWNLAWSPDSKTLVFNDRRLELWIADVTTSTTTRVDTSPYTAQDSWTPSFSHDSRYLAYAKTLKNRTSAVFIYDLGRRNLFR